MRSESDYSIRDRFNEFLRLVASDQVDEAEQILRECLAAGKDDANYISWSRLLTRSLSSLLLRKDDVGGAIEIFHVLIDQIEGSNSAENDLLIYEYHELARLYIHSMKLAEAEEMLLRCLANYKSSMNRNELAIVGVVILLVEVACLKSDLDGAKKHILTIENILREYRPESFDLQTMKQRYIDKTRELSNLLTSK